LLENAKNYNSEKIEKLVSFISISAKNAYNLLDNLLIWSRSQSGKIPFEPQKLILEEVCEQIISDLRLIAESKNIELTYNGENDVNVFADLNMLKTIIRNLLSNALKFTQKGGKVSIKAKMNADDTTISIHDNGVGISKEIKEKLFSNSEIQTTKGTENETGTGLGLIICDAFVKRHGGTITVKSIEDLGTEFLITIPILNEKNTRKISPETINTPII
jgi:signal transduction histidine kinase